MSVGGRGVGWGLVGADPAQVRDWRESFVPSAGEGERRLQRSGRLGAFPVLLLLLFFPYQCKVVLLLRWHVLGGSLRFLSIFLKGIFAVLPSKLYRDPSREHCCL